MDDKPKRPPRQAKKKAIEALDTRGIANPGTRKRSVSTHEPSDRAQKTRKKIPSPHVEEGTKNVESSFHKTPATKRMASHTGLTQRGTIVYASDMEAQIAAEAREVTRKNIPWDTFHSTYLFGFGIKAQPKPTVKSVKNIGKGSWGRKLFWDRLRQTLSNKVRCAGCAFISLSPLLTY
jgi:hypothetical protein